MQQQKVILVDLGGTSESSIMYGSMLVSKFQQAAFRRAKLAPEARVPHYLYVDEFANFQTSEFETILSQGRKFQLCLTVANQWVSQLSTEIRSAVLGGASTWFLFRLSPEDISFFKTHAPPVRHYDTNDYCTVNEKGEVVYDYWEDRRLRPPFDLAQLGRLDRGIALHCRAEGIANVTHLPGPPAIHQGMNYAEIIKKRTIEKYGCAPRQGPIHSAHDNKGTGQRDQGKHQDARKPRDSADEASASSGGADKPDSEFFE